MDTHSHILPMFRAFLVVTIVCLALFLLSTFSPKGILLGFAFVYIALLVSTSLR